VEEVKSAIEMGDKIVIGVDVNDRVLNCALTQALQHPNVGLYQPIINRHGSTGLPETYI
jgi:hypothetical protein